MRPGAAAEGNADGGEAVDASVRPSSHPVAGRIVIANPYFGSPAAGGSASYPLGVAPDDLRVVPAHTVAGVETVLIVSGFRGPIVHHFDRRRLGAGKLKKILAVG